MEKNAKVRRLTDLMGLKGGKDKDYIIEVNTDEVIRDVMWAKIVRENKTLGTRVMMTVSEEFAASLLEGGELAEMRAKMVMEELDRAEVRLLSWRG